MLHSAAIPIIKDKIKSANNSENHRGISISSAMGKVLDLLIINSKLVNSSQYQFAVKTGSSNSHFTFVAEECVNYFV
jgi:hypothetical protein